ncbi:UPF0489 family protein [Schinkia azotoformans]|uniref:UPF0489 family protein n=1 Tax=Schinkia azotoformans TaxID=1454 RepID=UPI002DBC6FBA|nr:UPF0489 family protein [Schinkia azotoformans]MEC1742272.1 UPF0489 family protein [Schinkia azotoformans]MEC1767499.1 UPF0489 family protein [Schinkia azotoformans]MED4419822.1 UPF0489 family protein [Schinkia azotoformans]
MYSILDIDMDFFIDDIAHWVTGDNRLDENEYNPWSEKDFRFFLEEKCLLSKSHPTKGKIVTNHHEAFFFWDELISSQKLRTPFKVTHIDAHSDTGLGDSGYVYIMGELLNHPIGERRNNLDTKKVFMSNYLSYALACGWISNIDFVLHEKWDNDIISAHLKNFSDKEQMFQFKGYPKGIDIGMSYERIVQGKISPIRIDKEIPYTLIPWQNYRTEKKFDYVVFCQSPGYTPKTADFMLDIIKEYIFEI